MDSSGQTRHAASIAPSFAWGVFLFFFEKSKKSDESTIHLKNRRFFTVYIEKKGLQLPSKIS